VKVELKMSKAEKQKQEKLKERLDDQKPSDAAVPPAPKEKKQKKDKREKATKIGTLVCYRMFRFRRLTSFV